MASASVPDRRTMPIAPSPRGVEMAVIVSNSLVILMPSILNQVLVESKVLFCIENRTSTILSLANTKRINVKNHFLIIFIDNSIIKEYNDIGFDKKLT